MEQQDKIHFLLSMQEHPEQYTDEQLHQMITDDPELAELLEQLALTKQVLVKHEADEETIPVEEEWQKFYADHSEEIEALDNDNSDKPHTATIKEMTRILSNKVAASIIGVLFTAGLAFAAIHIVRMVNKAKPKAIQAEQTISSKPTLALPTDTINTDTTTNIKPIVFDNVPLEKMLPQIVTYYNKDVDFQNTDARQLRFYFVWKQQETLEVVLNRLNLFESIKVEMKDNKIVVE